MDPIRVAIIGQGRSGRDIHGAYFKSEANTKFKVVAVVDALDYRRERAAQEYGCDVYADYKELFGRDDIDLVVNSTFSYQHVPVTIDLLEHGLNVVCEKPFAQSYLEGTQAIRAARKAGKMLDVFQQSRFAPYYVRIKEILESGKLGKPIQINISFDGFARRWDWQTSRDFGGGNVRNTGPHPLDQAMDLLGFPEEVNVFSRLGCVNTAGDAEDYAKILLDVPGKPLIDVAISSCNCYNPYTYVISCSNGCLRATQQHIEIRYFDPAKAAPMTQILTPLETPGDKFPMYCRETLEWIEEEEDVQGSAFNSAVAQYYEMIYQHLVNGKDLIITPEQVLTQLKVIDKIHAQNPLPLK